MIDHEERQQIEQRAKGARRAVETVQVHTDGGLFGEVPLSVAAQLFPATVSSARDVPKLLDELDRLAPAAYVHGLTECREHECDHIDREADPYGDCPQVEHRVATLADVKRAEYLDELAQQLRATAEAFQRGEEDAAGRSLAQLVLEGINDTYARIYCDEDANPVVSAAGLVSADGAGTPHDPGEV